ncbi:hypothetical protein [Halostagnicola kamekurae]|nr:hypothetical protein [Halostagnicola kamekurae]
MSLSKLFEVLAHAGTDATTDSSRRPDGTVDRTVVHECRTCGTSVSDRTIQCPACEGTDIVTYAID